MITSAFSLFFAHAFATASAIDFDADFVSILIASLMPDHLVIVPLFATAFAPVFGNAFAPAFSTHFAPVFDNAFAPDFRWGLCRRICPDIPPERKIHFFPDTLFYQHRTLFRSVYFSALFRNLHNSVVDKSVQNSLLVSKSARSVSKSRNNVENEVRVINTGFCV